MDREILKATLAEDTSSAQQNTIQQRQEIINNLIDSSVPIKIERGTRNLIIAMEELSELQKEISKTIRGKFDKIGVIEEIIDVEHSIDVIKNIFQITDEELEKIRFAKLEQIKARCKDNNFT